MKASLKLLQTTLSIIDLLLDDLALLLQVLALILLSRHLVLGLLKLQSNSVPLLLGLGLHLVEGVDLVSYLRDGGVVLLPEHGESGLVRDVGLIQLHLELGELLLPPGVEGNLGGGVAAGLLQLLMELIKLAAQLSSSLVG